MKVSLVGAVVVMLAALSGCAAQAEILDPSTAAEKASDIPSDASAGHDAERYHFPTPGSAIDTGGAVILVEAPLERVLEVVLDFAEYKNIMPRLQDSRVMERSEEATDVYMRAPVLDGTVTIWGVMRFAPVKPYGEGGKKLSGDMIKGNLKVWRGAWKLTPLGPKRTALRLEMYADVDLPVPDSWITPELMWSSAKSISAVRDLAEGK
jgi:ribosome-associated toxin RatA of RatAB toxin-antitoxin module